MQPAAPASGAGPILGDFDPWADRSAKTTSSISSTNPWSMVTTPESPHGIDPRLAPLSASVTQTTDPVASLRQSTHLDSAFSRLRPVPGQATWDFQDVFNTTPNLLQREGWPTAQESTQPARQLPSRVSVLEQPTQPVQTSSPIQPTPLTQPTQPTKPALKCAFNFFWVIFLPVLLAFVAFIAYDATSYYYSLEADHDRIGVITFVPLDSLLVFYTKMIENADPIRMTSNTPKVVESHTSAESPNKPSGETSFEATQQQQHYHQQPQKQVLDDDAETVMRLSRKILGEIVRNTGTGDDSAADGDDDENTGQRKQKQKHGTAALISATTTLRRLLIQADRLTHRNYLLCAPIRQFNPVKGVFHYKRACWDNLYYNVLLKMVSPLTHKQNLIDAARYHPSAPINAYIKSFNEEQDKLASSLRSMSGVVREQHIASMSDCLCGEQVGFPDAFVIVCEVPSRNGQIQSLVPVCKMFIYPQIDGIDAADKLRPRSDRANDHDDDDADDDDRDLYVVASREDEAVIRFSINYDTSTHIGSSSVGDGHIFQQQKDFDRGMSEILSIRDFGYLYRPENVEITYYELPSLEQMLFHFNATWANPALAQMAMDGRYQKLFSRQRQGSLLDGFYDFIRDLKIGEDASEHESIKGVTRMREEILDEFPGLHRLYQMRMENIRKAELNEKNQEATKAAKKRTGFLSSVTGKSSGSDASVSNPADTFSCSDFMKRLENMRSLTDLHLTTEKGMTKECLQKIFDQPRLVKNKASLTGHAANCVVYCSRMTDTYRLRALEYDFLNDARSKHSTQDFERAMNKIQSADAYIGIYYDHESA
jgi:hypothetical protein